MHNEKSLFTRAIMDWGRNNYRAFMWRRSRDLFTMLVAEFLLRKTRSESVDTFMTEFLKKYRSFEELNHVPLSELREELRPLGLQNERAEALKKIASRLSNKTKITYDEVMELPHCGRYMANAIECFYNGKRCAIVDNNIQRILNRFFSIPKAIEVHKADYLWDFALELLPPKDHVKYNYHLLDFSAIVCKPVGPTCETCPVASGCDYESSRRRE